MLKSSKWRTLRFQTTELLSILLQYQKFSFLSQMEKHIKTLIVLSHYLEVQSFSSPLSTILSKLKTPQLPNGSYFGKDKSLEFMQLCIYLRDLSFNKLEQELKILNLQLI
ncbi:uncharacterized protein LOC133739945 [Rosa rugosa]|uniref:uncharacterized protein LOC133739945 n=1 Tax=Rosa rugosa TaxID=74645 RepID=UPI002B413298|nr:uncharacterized protein LOC133739945 [Rosa rugosa]